MGGKDDAQTPIGDQADIVAALCNAPVRFERFVDWAVRTASLVERSDCVVCQAGGRVAHKVHSLWDGGKNPGCGLMDNSPLLHAGAWHGDLHGVLSRTMALRIVSILRKTAISAAFCLTPRASKRW